MTVPLSDDVARRVPLALMVRCEMGDLCAWMTLTTARVRVSKSRTSPERDPAAGGTLLLPPDAVRVWAAVERGDVAEGTGEG